jgi:hypothetical protein
MLSITQVFLNFKECINFCKSHGLILRRRAELELHPPFMAFVTLVMVCELIFQTQELRWLSRPDEI